MKVSRTTAQPAVNILIYGFFKYFLNKSPVRCMMMIKIMLSNAHKNDSATVSIALSMVISGKSSILKSLSLIPKLTAKLTALHSIQITMPKYTPKNKKTAWLSKQFSTA